MKKPAAMTPGKRPPKPPMPPSMKGKLPAGKDKCPPKAKGDKC